MKSLLIVGAGGYGQLVKDIAEVCGYERIDFVDDKYPNAVGKNADLDIIQDRYDGCVVTIGNPDVREQVFSRLKKPITIIHPSASISHTAI